MDNKPKVYVLTLNYNGLNWLKDCLDSINKLDYPNFNILLIDNGSSDDSLKFVRENYENIEILENGLNLGYSEGFNKGINYALDQGAEYVLIMNNDTVIDSKALIELVNTALLDPNIGFVSGKVYYYDRPEILQTVGRLSDSDFIIGPHVGSLEKDKGQYDEIKDYDFIDDVFMLVRAGLVRKIGPYDKSFFLQFEETDWCVRARKAGYRIVYTPKAKIWHKGTLSSGGTNSPINTFYNARNRTIFMRKNSTRNQWKHYIQYLIFNMAPKRIINLIVKGHSDLVFHYFSGIISSLIWVLQNNAEHERN